MLEIAQPRSPRGFKSDLDILTQADIRTSFPVTGIIGDMKRQFGFRATVSLFKQDSDDVRECWKPISNPAVRKTLGENNYLKFGFYFLDSLIGVIEQTRNPLTRTEFLEPTLSGILNGIQYQRGLVEHVTDFSKIFIGYALISSGIHTVSVNRNSFDAQPLYDVITHAIGIKANLIWQILRKNDFDLTKLDIGLSSYELGIFERLIKLNLYQ